MIGIAIIGTGFSGLGMAIRLRQSGREDFAIFERAEDVGGTWRDNVYPGCACDVESHLYSFSFAPNPRWTRSFSRQPEIWQYLRDCTERFGIRPFIRFGQEVRELAWEEERQAWRIETSQGVHYARVVVAGTGPLSEPALPNIPGLASFKGKVMHSARWDHGYDLRGKRVAVIGTGASAIQFVPEIQPQVQQLYLLQRTPPWVVARMDHPIDERVRARLESQPWRQRLLRLRIYMMREALGRAFRWPRIMRQLEKLSTRHMERAVRDPALRDKLRPNYAMGCKRILISNNYYPALTRSNVEVVTTPIREIRAQAVLLDAGRELEVDALILGTGFQTTEMPFAHHVRGRGGRALGELWNGSPRGFLGTSVPGFPNLFWLLGPNTGLGHNSVVLMIESQIEHVLKAVRHLKVHDLTALEAKPAAEQAFVAEVDKKMRGTVWVAGGCASWYIDRTGRNSTLWPRSVGSFRRRVEPFRAADYEEHR